MTWTAVPRVMVGNTSTDVCCLLLTLFTRHYKKREFRKICQNVQICDISIWYDISYGRLQVLGMWVFTLKFLQLFCMSEKLHNKNITRRGEKKSASLQKKWPGLERIQKFRNLGAPGRSCTSVLYAWEWNLKGFEQQNLRKNLQIEYTDLVKCQIKNLS